MKKEKKYLFCSRKKHRHFNLTLRQTGPNKSQYYNIRTATDVINSLFGNTNKEQDVKNNNNPEPINFHKHTRAFMCDKSKAIKYGLENIKKRMGNVQKPFVVLIDGDRGLENKVRELLTEYGLDKESKAEILDFIHVTEYIWKAANAHFGEKDIHRVEWVKQQCLLILESNTEQVLLALNDLHEQNYGKTGKQNTIKKSITYLKNHLHMMDYKRYLSEGYPISTGAIESACGHFVQSRMERNGMHWTIDGAQNILDIRAINKNKNWENYMEYYIEKSIQEIYCSTNKLIA